LGRQKKERFGPKKKQGVGEKEKKVETLAFVFAYAEGWGCLTGRVISFSGVKHELRRSWNRDLLWLDPRQRRL